MTDQPTKSCPFCGEQPIIYDGIRAKCNTSACELSIHPAITLKDWNSAWAHKRIAELEATVRDRETMLDKWCHEHEITPFVMEVRLRTLESLVRELAAGLNKIANMESMTFAECSDAEFIIVTAKEALAKVPEHLRKAND